MDAICESELLAKIEKNLQWNLVAFVVTPWAAHGVDAFIEYMNDCGIQPNGTICVIKHGQAGYLVDCDHFSFSSKDIHICTLINSTMKLPIVKKIKMKLNMYANNIVAKQKGNRNIFILNQGSMNYEWHARLKKLKDGRIARSVIIDEGIGMYMRDKKTWIKEDCSNASSLKEKLSIVVSRYVVNPLMQKRLSSEGELMNFSILQRNTKNELISNEVSVKYYKTVIHRLGIRENIERLSIYENAIVVNTQPFYEYNQVFEDEDIQIIQRLCELCAKKGIKVVLKPHPREKNIDRYNILKNCWIDDRKGITQESIISQLTIKPKAIVGFSSTTLISERVFDEIPAISLIRCVNIQNIETKMRADFVDFERSFKRFASFPQNWEELDDCLDSLK